MKIEQLKSAIENNAVDDSLLIFQYEDTSFIAEQYIKEISKLKKLSIEYLDSIDTLGNCTSDIFGIKENNISLRVYKCDVLDSNVETLSQELNLIIICKKINANTKKLFDSYIIQIPKLELWQLKDYIYSNAEGIDQKELDWLIEVCQHDIYRLENELDKFRLFSEEERKYLFDDMKYQGAYSDVSSFNVFNITNAVTQKNIPLLQAALTEIKNFDAEPLGVVTLLYQGFKKLIQVWLAKNPTPENTGLKANMIYAINKSPRVYTKEQLIECFLTLTSIDKQLKTGKIEIPWLIDYVICKVLSC